MFRRRLGKVTFLVRGESASIDPWYYGCHLHRHRRRHHVTTQHGLDSSSASTSTSSSFSTSSSSNNNNNNGGNGTRGSSHSNSHSSSYSANGPSRQSKSWESGARMVQNTTVENKYLEHIREVHDPSQHLKTIEDELKGTIGKALGKQGQKILLYARLMEEERTRYEDLLRQSQSQSSGDNDNDNNANNTYHDKDNDNPQSCMDLEIQKSAIAHNEHRKQCLHARWELTVHRQAVGFIVGNHKFVQEKFPVGDALPVQCNGFGDGDGGNSGGQQNTSTVTSASGTHESNKKKKFTDQLDWWERIGRWK